MSAAIASSATLAGQGSNPKHRRKMSREMKLEIWQETKKRGLNEEQPRKQRMQSHLQTQRTPTPARRPWDPLPSSSTQLMHTALPENTHPNIPGNAKVHPRLNPHSNVNARQSHSILNASSTRQSRQDRPSSGSRAISSSRPTAQTPIHIHSPPSGTMRSTLSRSNSFTPITRPRTHSRTNSQNAPNSKHDSNSKPNPNTSPIFSPASGSASNPELVPKVDMSMQTDAVEDSPKSLVDSSVQVTLYATDAENVKQLQERLEMARQEVAANVCVNAIHEQKISELETRLTRDIIDHDTQVEDLCEQHAKEIKKVKREMETRCSALVKSMQDQLREGLEESMKCIGKLEAELQAQKQAYRDLENKLQAAPIVRRPLYQTKSLPSVVLSPQQTEDNSEDDDGTASTLTHEDEECLELDESPFHIETYADIHNFPSEVGSQIFSNTADVVSSVEEESTCDTSDKENDPGLTDLGHPESLDLQMLGSSASQIPTQSSESECDGTEVVDEAGNPTSTSIAESFTSAELPHVEDQTPGQDTGTRDTDTDTDPLQLDLGDDVVHVEEPDDLEERARSFVNVMGDDEDDCLDDAETTASKRRRRRQSSMWGFSSIPQLDTQDARRSSSAGDLRTGTMDYGT